VSGKRVLDSYPLLAYLKKEDKYEKVKNLLGSKGEVLLMNEVNLGQCFYIIARERGMDRAEYFLQTILPSLPIIKRPNTFQNVIEAAKIKAAHALSHADCFAVQTAREENAPSSPETPSSKRWKSL
jgi:predicted nucleic acid-binding protein